MPLKPIAAFVIVLVAALACGCSEDSPDGGGAAETEPTPSRSSELQLPPARTAAIPGESAPSGAAPPAGHSRPMVWEVPQGWVEVEPSSSMRLAQYRVDGPGGSGECVVYYFGPGQGGDARSNATRWANQFAQTDGRPSTDVMQYTELQGAQVPVSVVEVTGTYNGGLSMTGEAPEELTGYMLLGGIAEGPDAPWFFKFTGPESTVKAQRGAFMDMMKSIGGSG